MRLPRWFFATPCVLAASERYDRETGELVIGDVYRGMCMLYERGASKVTADEIEGSFVAKAILQDARLADMQRFTDGRCVLDLGGGESCTMRIAAVRRMRLPGAKIQHVMLELVACG